ncbi:hypothetical protein DRP04_09895 [Archaeoglobales archaeon]|nr:MAG: hypothetical protein DRP04_09895 [Archaeoglobales archaeon]
MHIENENTMIEKLEFCSIFSYCPRDESDEGLLAIKLKNCIKNDEIIKIKRTTFKEGRKVTIEEVPTSQYAAEVLKRLVNERYFSDFFQKDTILIPVPRATPIKKDQLWPSFQIAKAMENEGLGVVRPILVRTKPVPKSSLVPPKQRPKPKDHYESMGINKVVKLDSQKLLLVDDVVTRGHTFMGAAWRLKREFSNVEIKAFAAMRTISDKSKFKKYYDPVRGVIFYRHKKGDCLRRESRILKV